MQTPADIPPHLEKPARAALAWLNKARDSCYELTGVIEPEAAGSTGDAYELGLVLCDGEICAREQVRVMPSGEGYDFSSVDIASPSIPPLLDPPLGLRRDWLEEQRAKFDFIVLLFYRGRW